jgi:hypothetical protein
MLVSNASIAHQALGWQPRITELDDIVRSAWAWHQRSSQARTGGRIGQPQSRTLRSGLANESE